MRPAPGGQVTDGFVDVPGGAASRSLRLFIAIVLAIAFAVFGVTSFAVVLPLAPALPLGVAAGAIAGWLFWHRPPVAIDAAACSRGLKIASALATALALIQIGRISVYMISAAQPGWSVIPGSDWEVRHSCLSAYYVASKADARRIYDESLYTDSKSDPTAVRKPGMLGPFRIDVYEYPPPFLTLPRLLGLAAPDFMRLRPLWFGLTSAAILLSMIAVLRLLSPPAATRALLLLPLVWAAIPTQSMLQKGNVQGLVIALAVLAMARFERRRWVSGGALLAFATLSKLFPALLAIALLVQRKWRALAWTCVAGVALLLISVVDLGLPSYSAFLEHLPGLLGGESFPALRNPKAMAINTSIPGIVFKLKVFGIAGMTFAVSKAVGWIYTVVAIWAVVVLARRALQQDEKPVAWITMLLIATLRSPFLPQAYASFTPLWLLTLLAALYPADRKTLVWTLAGWGALTVFWPMDWATDPRRLALLTILPQATTILLAALVVRRALSPTCQPHSAAVAAAS